MSEPFEDDVLTAQIPRCSWVRRKKSPRRLALVVMVVVGAVVGAVLIDGGRPKDPVAVQTAGEAGGETVPSDRPTTLEGAAGEAASTTTPPATAPDATTTSGAGTVVAAGRPKPKPKPPATTTRPTQVPSTTPPLPVTTLPPTGGSTNPTIDTQSAFERDPSFGTDGLFTADIGGSLDKVADLVRQSDGKLLVGGDGMVGQHLKAKVLRLTADGKPDPTFGEGGWFTADGDHILNSLTLQADGKILVAANVGAFGYGGVLRLDRDGHLDPSFGNDGVLDTNQTATQRVIVLPNGKLVMVGMESTSATQADVSIARYTSTGEPDESFGDGGRTVVDIGSTPSEAWWNTPTDAVRLDDDSFLVVGAHHTSSVECCPGSEALVMRFTSDGDLDETFGDGGYRTFDYEKNIQAVAVVPDSGGRAVVGLHVGPGLQRLLRLGPDGELDPTFGDGGVTGYGAASLGALTRDPEGRLLTVAFGASYELHRFSADGRPDSTLGYRSDINRFNEFPTAVLVLPDGRILVAGYSYRDLTLASVGQNDADWFLERIRRRA